MVDGLAGVPPTAETEDDDEAMAEERLAREEEEAAANDDVEAGSAEDEGGTVVLTPTWEVTTWLLELTNVETKLVVGDTTTIDDGEVELDTKELEGVVLEEMTDELEVRTELDELVSADVTEERQPTNPC